MGEEWTRKSLLGKASSGDDDNNDNGLEGKGGEGEYDEPLTAQLLLTTFTALCATFSYGTAAGYTSPTQLDIMSKLDLSLAEFAFFGSVLTIGGVVGASMSGLFSDHFGRRGTLWISNVFCIIGWVAIMFSQGAWSLDIGRLLLGIGAGLISFVVPVLIVEIAPRSHRGAFTAVNTLVMSTAISITYLIGSITSWRSLAFISMCPCLVELMGLMLIPESPRWLARTGRVEEATAALQRLRGSSCDVSREAAEIQKYMANVERLKEDGFYELFHPRYRRAITVGMGILVLQQLGGLSGYAFYMSSIFHKAHIPDKIGMVAASLTQFVTNIIGLLIIDAFGRRPLMTVATILMCIASVVTGLSFLFQEIDVLNRINPVLTLLGVLMFVTSLSVGIGGIPWIMVSEITPINIKGSAGTVANVVSWTSNWLVAFSFNFLFLWSPYGVFFIYAAVSGLGVLFVAKMVPETKGRSLEDIQASITR